MTKFSKLALPVDQPGRLTIIHPLTRQPLRDKDGEAYIDLYSGDSETAQRYWRTIQRRRLNMRVRPKLTPEELEAESVEFLASVTVGWRLLGLDGLPIDEPFSQESARELYAERELAWLREQVDEFVGDRSNFSRPSPKT